VRAAGGVSLFLLPAAAAAAAQYKRSSLLFVCFALALPYNVIRLLQRG